MALLWYLQCEDGLPDPRGLCLSSIPPQAIVYANQKVQAATENEVLVREKWKCGTYHCYTPEDCAATGRYASHTAWLQQQGGSSPENWRKVYEKLLYSQSRKRMAYVAGTEQKRRDIVSPVAASKMWWYTWRLQMHQALSWPSMFSRATCIKFCGNIFSWLAQTTKNFKTNYITQKILHTKISQIQ